MFTLFFIKFKEMLEEKKEQIALYICIVIWYINVITVNPRLNRLRGRKGCPLIPKVHQIELFNKYDTQFKNHRNTLYIT